MPEPEDSTPVEYDMSFSTNTRINVLLWQCNEAYKNENVSAWFKCCKNLYKECLGKMLKDKQDDRINKNKKFIKDSEKALNDYNNYIEYYQRNDNDDKFIPPREIYDLLFEWEGELRSYLIEIGLIFKDKDMSAF